MGGHHHRLAQLAAGADDVFLDLRHAFCGHFHPQVAPGHHDRVAQLGDFPQLGDGRRLLDLGHQVGLVADQRTGFTDVFRALHEGQGHPVHPQFQAEAQVATVLGRQRAEVEHRLGHVDPLAVRQLTAIEHGGLDGIGVLGDHPQAQLAVVQQQVHARLQGGDDLRVRQADPLGVARGRVEVQAQGLAAHQLHLALGEGADPQLRPLQVHEDAQGVVQFALYLADPLVALGVVGMGAVAEIEPEDVHPGLHQLTDVLDAVDGRAQGGEDFDLLVRRHVWGSRESGWRGSR